MLAAFVVLLVALGLALAYAIWQSNRRLELERERVIRTFVFPPGVIESFRTSHPFVDTKGVQLVARALRQFFLVHSRAKSQLASMPSKAADALWHAFILDTKAYSLFCRQAFCTYFHHIPEQVNATSDELQSASWVTWRLACLEENINPARASRLPLLYAIDTKVGYPGAVVHDPKSFKQPSSPGGCSGGGGGSSSDGDGGGGCGGE
jgi:hypothetical protein